MDMPEIEAASAALLAFHEARSSGADHAAALDVMVARYRAYFPDASRDWICRQVEGATWNKA